MQQCVIRPALTSDIRAVSALMQPLVEQRILLGRSLVFLYESVQQFVVAEVDGEIIGCGALHVMWEDLGEIRSLIVRDDWLRKGIGHAIVEHLINDARALGLTRLFCLTFETEFFSRHGFEAMDEKIVDPDVYAQMLISHDEGIAEFLDLAHVKPNTLGNTRMLKRLNEVVERG